MSAIGVSNFDPHELKELLSIARRPVAVVQNWMDVFHQDTEVSLNLRYKSKPRMTLTLLYANRPDEYVNRMI